MSVSSDTVASWVPLAPAGAGHEADPHGGVADLDRGTVLERRLLDPGAVDQHAVRRAQIDDADLRAAPLIGIHPDLRVPAGHPRVVDPQIGVGAAADHDSRRIEWMLDPVDLQGAVGPPYRGVGDRPGRGDRGP